VKTGLQAVFFEALFHIRLDKSTSEDTPQQN
jgi:hypothetical protein